MTIQERRLKPKRGDYVILSQSSKTGKQIKYVHSTFEAADTQVKCIIFEKFSKSYVHYLN